MCPVPTLGRMTTHASPRGVQDAGKEFRRIIGECDLLLRDREERINRLQAGVTRIRDVRVEAETALNHLLGAPERARLLRSSLTEAAGSSQPPDAGTDDGSHEDEQSADQQTENTTAQEPPPIEISGNRSIEIMKVLETRPEHPWSAQEVAVARGHGDDDNAVRLARSGLDFLCDKRVLIKSTTKEGKKPRTHYTICAPWRFA